MSENSDRLLNKTDIAETSDSSSSCCSKPFECSRATSLTAILQSFHFSAAMLVAMQLSPKWNNCMYLIPSLGNLAFLTWKGGCWKLQIACRLPERLLSDPPALPGWGGGCQVREQGRTQDMPSCCQRRLLPRTPRPSSAAALHLPDKLSTWCKSRHVYMSVPPGGKANGLKCDKTDYY